MSRIYSDSGKIIPVTLIEMGPCPVLQIKTKKNDGYEAVQIGFGKQKKHRINKPTRGHLAKTKTDAVRHLKEFRIEGARREFEMGQILTVEEFKVGQRVDVTANTKGKGFQGVVKRYGFKGGRASHGSMFHRRGGSYGQCQWPGEIAKGKKMPGHMGNVSRTTQNLIVIKVLKDKNVLLVRGSVHGTRGGTVYVRQSVKTKKA